MQDQPRLAKHGCQMARQRVGDLAVLGEHQDFFLFGGDFLAQFAQPMEFSAVGRCIRPVAKPLGGMIADLFEAGQKGEDDAPALDTFGLRGLQPFRQFVDGLLIERGLAAGQRAKSGDFSLLRQIADDPPVRFESTQDVGTH